MERRSRTFGMGGQAVRGRMKQTAVAQQFAVILRAVNTWAALDQVSGLQALKSWRRGRRVGEGLLDATRSARMQALIVGKMPDQSKHLCTERK